MACTLVADQQYVIKLCLRYRGGGLWFMPVRTFTHVWVIKSSFIFSSSSVSCFMCWSLHSLTDWTVDTHTHHARAQALANCSGALLHLWAYFFCCSFIHSLIWCLLVLRSVCRAYATPLSIAQAQPIDACGASNMTQSQTWHEHVVRVRYVANDCNYTSGISIIININTAI